MSSVSDVENAVLANPIPIIEAGVSLISTIVQMIKNAQAAKGEQHDAILAHLQAADAALKSAQDDAHKALADELAKDSDALKAAGVT